MDIGFVGLGRMGGRMALNLIAAGHTLVVHDLDRAACDAAIAAGATWADSPAELASRSETIVSSVPGPAEVADVMTADDGVLAGVSPGALVIETSTIGPAQSRDLHRRLAEKGASFVDATVNRIRMDGVAEGRMTVMVGGEAADFERAQPILECLGDRIHHLGPVGSGNVLKLLNQMIFLSYVEVFCEGLALGQRLGLEVPAMLRVFETSAAAHPMIVDKHDMFETGDDAPGFAIGRVIKDLELADELRTEADYAAPGFAAVLAAFKRAAEEGFADKDMTVLHGLLRDGRIAG